MDIKFIKPTRLMRTQFDNVNSLSELLWQRYSEPDKKVCYDLTTKSITENYCEQILGYQPNILVNEFDPGINVPNLFSKVNNKPICLIKPNTLRNEWFITSRNPKSEYLQKFVDMYRDQFYIISLANLSEDVEFYEKKLKGCHYYIEEAKSLDQTIHLFKLTSLIVCSVSFWVPLALAMNKRTICLYGGHVPPQRIVDSRISRPNFATLAPDPFCFCYKLKHECNKEISQTEIERIFKEQTHAAIHS